MTDEQLEQALEMHNSGVTWLLIAIYFKTTTQTLRKRLEHYATTTN